MKAITLECNVIIIFKFFLKILFIFRQRGRERERVGGKHQYVVASHMPPTRDVACNPGMCPDQESNQRSFGLQAGAQSTELHQPGHNVIILVEKV